MRPKPSPVASRTKSLLALGALLACGPLESRTGAGDDWPLYRGDLAGTGHSSLRDINSDNVAGLVRAWSYDLAADPASGARTRGPGSQATPIVVNEVMYLPAADRVVALDPASGAELWRHPVAEGGLTRRGVAYWPGEGDTPPRILFMAGARLIAIDAASGALAEGFGRGGAVDIGVPYNSVPLVYEHIVVVGANTPPGAPGGIGNARAFDARDGSPIWEFSSVPRPGEVGHDTWGGDSWRGRLGANAWPFYFTLDQERELLYLPLASPIPFWYGGDRPGANLFGNSVVAVDVRTGTYVWHFQTIHHDLWDHDPPAPPVLFDAHLASGTVPALALTTKSGYVYVLDRETGEPVFGVEERPVPVSDVPGEIAYPTQPIPTLPLSTSRVSYAPSDLVGPEDTSPEHAAACAALVTSIGEIYHAGPFTPWAYRAPGTPQRTTLLFPGLLGGHNWGGGAFDPEAGLVFVFSQDVGTFGWIEEDSTADALVPYRRSGPRPASFDVAMDGARWPCQKPPWGRLTAVDAATGALAWQVPVGVTAGLPPDRMNTGRPGRASAISTAGGVLFIGATDDGRFRALDSTTGRELWVDELPAPGNANPLTYRGPDGRQYVAIAATDAVLAYRLP